MSTWMLHYGISWVALCMCVLTRLKCQHEAENGPKCAAFMCVSTIESVSPVRWQLTSTECHQFKEWKVWTKIKTNRNGSSHCAAVVATVGRNQMGYVSHCWIASKKRRISKNSFFNYMLSLLFLVTLFVDFCRCCCFRFFFILALLVLTNWRLIAFLSCWFSNARARERERERNSRVSECIRQINAVVIYKTTNNKIRTTKIGGIFHVMTRISWLRFAFIRNRWLLENSTILQFGKLKFDNFIPLYLALFHSSFAFERIFYSCGFEIFRLIWREKKIRT